MYKLTVKNETDDSQIMNAYVDDNENAAILSMQIIHDFPVPVTVTISLVADES